MAKNPLDLSNFKKTSEDETTAILTHKDGHKIHIAKNVLSGELKKKVSALPLFQADPQVPVGDAEAVGGATAGVGAATAASTEPQVESDETSTDPGGNVMGQPLDPQQVAQEQASPIPSDYNKAYSQEENANNVQQQALREQAQSDQAIHHQGVDEDKQAAADLHGVVNDSNKEINDVVSDIKNNYIKPNDYLENMSAGKKFTTAIGLLLGGMGTKGQGPNPAMQFLQSQIERNLQAQQANQGSRHNLLTALQEKYHNNVAAQNMFRAITAHSLSEQLNEAAAKAGTPMAQAANLKAQADLANKYLPLKRQADAFQFFQGSNVSPAAKLRVGQMAGIVTPEQYTAGNKELAKAQEAEEVRAELHKSFNDLDGRVLAGKLSPTDRSSAVNSIAGRLEHLGEGRFNLEEAKLQANSVLPGIESDDTRNLKAQRLDALVDGLVQTPTLQGLGINLQRGRLQRGASTKTVKGVTYKRGPNGEAIPVK